MTIINAVIHSFDKKDTVFQSGYIRFENGKITERGDMKDYTDQGDTVINAEGKPLYPGLFDAHTHLGLYGDSLTFEGDDGNEDTDPVMPQLRALDAINPMDGYFKEALSAGITAVITGPGSANPVAGQLAAVKTKGCRIDKMAIKAPVGIKFSLGENPKSTYNDKEQSPVTRMATAALIRECLVKARKYYNDKCRYNNDPENYDEPETDFRNESLLPLFSKDIPAHFHAHRADDIFTAIRIADEFDIDYVIVHGTDAHLICDELEGERLKGILSGPVLTDRSKPELSHQTPKAPGIISSKGIPTAIITDHPETPVNYLLLCAAVAVKNGMDRTEAMRAVTINPARICGLDDRIGSLEVGKDADMVVFSGDPLDIFTEPLLVAVDGNIAINKFCENV